MPICISGPSCKLTGFQMQKHSLWIERTTLATFANTSRSDGTAVSVALTDATSDGDSRAISRLHSVARDRKMEREISRDLQKGLGTCNPYRMVNLHPRTNVPCLGLPTFCLEAFLQFSANFCQLSRMVRPKLNVREYKGFTI